MIRTGLRLAPALLLAASLSAEARQSSAGAVAQDQPAPIRVGVDLVAVDVQVIGRDGHPVVGLGPDSFTVTINGKRRRVASADLIDSRSTGRDAEAPPAPGTSTAPSASPRTIVLAIDCLTFDAGVSRSAVEAARSFVRRLPPADRVGLFVYPTGATIEPTTDRDTLLRALNTVVGQRDTTLLSQFHLRPAEIVDLLAAVSSNNEAALIAAAASECPPPADPNATVDQSCSPRRLISELKSTAIYYEGQAHASLGMLRSVVKQMGTLPGRKILVLLSGGLLASDVPGGRPDIGELGIQVGKEAARANTAIYALYLDTSFLTQFSADTQLANAKTAFIARDSAILGRWLDQFSGAAGGTMFSVQAGSGEAAFDRIIAETAHYYLLGVEPAEADRTDRPYEITIKTDRRNVTVRGRKWVTVPSRATAAANAAAAAPPSAAGATAAPAAPVKPAPRVVPKSVQELADLSERGDWDGLEQSLKQSPDLANLIRTFRTSDNPWPDSPHRTALLALELGAAGLRSNNGYAKDEGARLLAQYTTLVRGPSGADAFECAWLWGGVSALEGLFLPEGAMIFVSLALGRCPNEPRFYLAYAMLSEQQTVRGGPGALGEADIVRRYETAMKYPETEAEARVRAAWYLARNRAHERALALLDPPRLQTPDRQVQYYAHLVRGQVLRGLNRPDEAIRALRAALETWPGAQSARVALMTLLVSRGEREEAAALAQAAETATADQFDPWWVYWLGDYRAYPVIITHLRQMASR